MYSLLYNVYVSVSSPQTSLITVRARLFAIAVARTSRMCSFIRSSTSSIVITFCDLSNVPPPFRDMLSYAMYLRIIPPLQYTDFKKT